MISSEKRLIFIFKINTRKNEGIWSKCSRDKNPIL